MNIKINKEIILNELKILKLKTKDIFTKKLIEDLEKRLINKVEFSFYENLDFEKIKNLIEKEKIRNKIKNNKNISKGNFVYVFEINLKGKKSKIIDIKGNKLLSNLSKDIQKLFNHEPMHLYEFKLNNYKFGPECDEWQEIFDHLDNIRIDSALNSINFKIGGIGEFIYDFGENIKHKIKLIEIRKIK